ncbi:MAG: HAD family hydrolase [Muricoprocola sp.]
METKKHGYDAVVFDMDGVIFDSERLVLKCWNEVAQKHGIGDMEEVCLKCTGLTVNASRDVMKEYFGEDFPYDVYKEEMSRLFHERYGGGRLPLKTGVIELLSFLKEQGKKVALASSTRSQVVKQELEDAGIISYFDELICGDMVKHSKPAPDIFAKACECLGIRPERAFGIEDSHNGIRSAAAAGLRPIMVPDLVPATEEMERVSEQIFPSLIEVKNYLEKFEMARLIL